MSYARFGWDGSDVYVFDSEGGIRCCNCRLAPEVPCPPAMVPGFHGDFKAETKPQMLAHLNEHKNAGHVVPDDCMEELAE